MPSKVDLVGSAIRIASGVLRVFSPTDPTAALATGALDRLGGALDAADGAFGVTASLDTPVDKAVARTARRLADTVPERYRTVTEMASTRVQDGIAAMGAERAMALALIGEQDFLDGIADAAGQRLLADLSDHEEDAVRVLLRATRAGIVALAQDPDLVGTAMVVAVAEIGSRDTDVDTRLSRIERELGTLRAEAQRQRGKARLISGSRPARAVGFIERSVEATVWGRLRGDDTVTVQSLTGMRGTGKSQIASAIAARCIDAGWQTVLWVDAVGRAEIVRHFADIALSTGLGHPSLDAATACARFLSWVASQPSSDRLIVFDNVVDLDDLRGLVPRASGLRVLVTATVASESIGEPVAIGLFDRTEACRHLLTRVGLDDPVAADRVADALGDLPLAVAQAATTMRLLGIGYDEYLVRLRDHPLQGSFIRAEGDAYPELVDIALLASIEAVLGTLRQDERARAQLMLHTISAMSEVGVPLAWLVDAEDDPWTARATLARLVEHSILGRSDDGTHVSLHRLTARALREAATGSQISVEATTNALGIVDHARESVSGEFLVRRVQLSDLATQLRSIVDHAPELPETIVTDAVEILDRVLRATSDAHIPSAGVELARSLEILEAAGAEGPPLARASTSLASVLNARGERERGLSLLRRSMAIFESAFGSRHPETLASRLNLAHGLMSAGEPVRAADILEPLLSECRDQVGPDDPLTLACRKNLAEAYRRSGDHRRSVDAFSSLLADIEKNHDPDDMFLTDVRLALASAYEQTGDHPESVSAFETALATLERIAGPDHHRTTEARRGLGRAQTAAGRPDLAIPIAEQALADQIRVSGEHHHSTIDARAELASAYEAAGDVDRAVEHLDRATRDHEEHVGVHHHDTFMYRNRLAVLLVETGSYAEGTVLLRRTLSEFTPALTAEYAGLLRTTRMNLVLAHLKRNHFVGAQAALEESARRGQFAGPDRDQVIGCLIAAARFSRRRGAPGRAVRLLAQARHALGHHAYLDWTLGDAIARMTDDIEAARRGCRYERAV